VLRRGRARRARRQAPGGRPTGFLKARSDGRLQATYGPNYPTLAAVKQKYVRKTCFA
jgi:hypothetical protein